jgi:hypothetical protein
MDYKKRLTYILSLIGALAFVYLASFIFDPEFTGTRNASYVWLDSKLAGRTAKIEIYTQEDTVDIVKKNGKWFVLRNDTEYPARQLRIEDFIGIFTSRSAWPVRSTSASSHDKLGVGTGNATGAAASRITLYGENSTLLDILLGSEDITGREIYLRRSGQNEVRSGENVFASYMGSVSGWYNLRLIPESEDGKAAVDSVQRLSVYSPDAAQVFSRKNRTWTVSGFQVVNPDQPSIDSYVRAVLNLEGDDFAGSEASDASMFNYGSLVLELGNGGVKTIRVSDADETGRRFARVDGFDYVYSIAPWAAQRLFRSAQDFEKQ